jgi:hypothetical protein
VAILGSHQVRNWARLRFTKVVVRYGRPVRFERHQQSTREQQQRVADEILRRIREMHVELAAAGSRAARLARERAAADRVAADREAADREAADRLGDQTAGRTAAAI